MKRNEKKEKKRVFKELVKQAREDSEKALELTNEGNHHVLDEEELEDLNERACKKSARLD